MAKNSVNTRPFRKWTVDDVAEIFGAQRVRKHPRLEAWIDEALKELPLFSKEQRGMILELVSRLEPNAEVWNEEELKVQFIGPLMFWVDYTDTRYKAFLERPLAATINGIEISGDVDFMLATGLSRPKEPFFFLHEYKRQFRGENDPLGQLLVAMIAARELNAVKRPMYGAVVQGLNWFFVVLDGLEYSVSSVFIATDKEDIFRIIAVLRYIRVIIDGFLTEKS
ncbi:MAG: hypothetical protein MUF71_04180 [Candidatus Kapabacteria bacterium]|jgi:hypothetical protein|nr:hypothetical protein [Candidatus Kapabacteria bacterium]